ncbi:MAG TPA: hypothetical protein VFU31_18475 [Candidatus Binatia bacterium]|nr:hypothetical protein [Candidatus Binatia bacterium]
MTHGSIRQRWEGGLPQENWRAEGTLTDSSSGLRRHGEPAVRLIKPHPRSPVSEIEALVVTLLANENELPYGEVIFRLAEFLYRNELRAWGSAVDIGLFGSSLFVSDARRALEAGKDELWEID